MNAWKIARSARRSGAVARSTATSTRFAAMRTLPRCRPKTRPAVALSVPTVLSPQLERGQQRLPKAVDQPRGRELLDRDPVRVLGDLPPKRLVPELAIASSTFERSR